MPQFGKYYIYTRFWQGMDSFHPCVFPNVSFCLLESVSTRLQSVKNPFFLYHVQLKLVVVHMVAIRFGYVQYTAQQKLSKPKRERVETKERKSHASIHYERLRNHILPSYRQTGCPSTVSSAALRNAAE